MGLGLNLHGTKASEFKLTTFSSPVRFRVSFRVRVRFTFVNALDIQQPHL